MHLKTLIFLILKAQECGSDVVTEKVRDWFVRPCLL